MQRPERESEQMSRSGRRPYRRPILTPRGKVRHVIEGFEPVVTDGKPIGAA